MLDETTDDDGVLDFLSPAFSAEQALLSSPSKIQLPCPEVQPCDNLEQYSSVVRGLSRKPQHVLSRSPLPSNQGEQKSLLVRRKQNLVKSVITLMKCESSGPLSLVQRYKNEGVKVRVVVRHCAGVRGECVGVILAFDKHLNLVLDDVNEIYTPFRTVTNGGLEPQTQRRRRRRKNRTLASDQPPPSSLQTSSYQLQRHLDKLFIRGDNIVLITSHTHTPSPPPLQSATSHTHPPSPPLL